MYILSEYQITAFISGQIRRGPESDTLANACGDSSSNRPPTRTRYFIPFKYVEAIIRVLDIYFTCDVKNTKQLGIKCMPLVPDSLSQDFLNELSLRKKLRFVKNTSRTFRNDI